MVLQLHNGDSVTRQSESSGSVWPCRTRVARAAHPPLKLGPTCGNFSAPLILLWYDQRLTVRFLYVSYGVMIFLTHHIH